MLARANNTRLAGVDAGLAGVEAGLAGGIVEARLAAVGTVD